MTRKRMAICPHCGSADVTRASKCASCNRCGKTYPIDKFLDHGIDRGERASGSWKHDVALAEDRRLVREHMSDDAPLDAIFRRGGE